jgi:hypothetical protein
MSNPKISHYTIHVERRRKLISPIGKYMILLVLIVY